MRLAPLGALAALAGLCLATATLARADAPVPPWVDVGVPFPSWARSVVPRTGERGRPGDLVLFSGPNRSNGKRGVTTAGASLPLFGAHAGGGCSGEWWLVGPLAWACSDDATLSPTDAAAPPAPIEIDGMPREYFFVGKDGASAYASLDAAAEGTPDRELESGWAVAVVEQRTWQGQRWAHTSKGLWIAVRDLGAARPSAFHGETLGDGPLDLAWVVSDKAAVYPQPTPKAKSKDARARLQVVHVLEESGPYVRIGEGEWMLARDVARPHVAPPPAEVGGSAERWIDVELATQTLVAYEGARPVYATLVSTGRGPPGTDSATPMGVHRIWVKILASDMDNVERDDLDAHYSLEDVPYVQFFDHAVGLHGTYWHRDFGHVKSHGCVNLAPLDARSLFAFTGPRMPTGWVAAYPVAVDAGTVVRVR
jgi:lipoprotein-anchoring transpeptidase ErfK/SrfK